MSGTLSVLVYGKDAEFHGCPSEQRQRHCIYDELDASLIQEVPYDLYPNSGNVPQPFQVDTYAKIAYPLRPTSIREV